MNVTPRQGQPVTARSLSTLVSFWAAELGVFWTGWAEELQASVVFIAPASQKAYLTVHRDQRGALIIDHFQAEDDYYQQSLRALLAEADNS